MFVLIILIIFDSTRYRDKSWLNSQFTLESRYVSRVSIDGIFDRAHCPLKELTSASSSSHIRELNERNVGNARPMMDDKIGGVYTRRMVIQPGKETFKFGKAIIQTAPDSTYHYIFLALLRAQFYSL